MALIDFTGRILFLSGDPQIIERQFAGEDIALVDAGGLRDDVSTDEITPPHVMTVWDDRLGRVPYLGFVAGGRNPIGIDAVKNGGFSVTVAGKRYGKGSSREHSPLAERSAGIRLVIAESFERIYRQNADNIGLFTSTDFGLVERHAARRSDRRGRTGRRARRAGRRDPARGGLLRYGQQRMRHITGPRHGRPSRRRARCPRRSLRGTCCARRRHAATRRRAKAPSCAPTGASSTSTTPAWRPHAARTPSASR